MKVVESDAMVATSVEFDDGGDKVFLRLETPTMIDPAGYWLEPWWNNEAVGFGFTWVGRERGLELEAAYQKSRN